MVHLGPEGRGPTRDVLRVVQAALPADARVVVGCQSGGRSLQAAALLAQAGYVDLVNQRAGFGGARDNSGRVVEPGWAAAGLPVESGAPAGRAYGDLLAKAK